MRVEAAIDGDVDIPGVRDDFGSSVAEPYAATWNIHDPVQKHRLLVMVSRQQHCLNDLLHRARTGSLPAEIVAVVSNHDELRDLVEWHGIPFHHVPVTPASKAVSR